MHNAARAVFEEIERRYAPKRVLLLAGPGNNGGDGLVLATLFGKRAHVILSHPSSELKTPEARKAFGRLERSDASFEPYSPDALRSHLKEADVVVDALLGSGITGRLRPPFSQIVKAVNRARKPVVAIDVPTGLGSSPTIRADMTVVLHAKKPGLTRATAGRLVVRDIGIPKGVEDEIGPGDFTATYPVNRAESHKGQNGRVLVVAGGPYTGAPLLSALACMRAGVDLVHLYTPRAAARAAQAVQPDLVVHGATREDELAPEDLPAIRKLLPKVDVVLMGPGLGGSKATTQAITEILSATAKARRRAVLDADALAVAGKDPRLVRALRPLATPHAGEYKELTGRRLPKDLDEAKRQAREQARRLRTTLLIKGPVDLITDGDRSKINRIHHPSMTVGGTGDVLAGLCAGFAAKGLSSFHAACAAAFVNGIAGRRVARRQGGSLVASDLIAEFPRVFRRFLSPPRPRD